MHESCTSLQMDPLPPTRAETLKARARAVNEEVARQAFLRTREADEQQDAEESGLQRQMQQAEIEEEAERREAEEKRIAIIEAKFEAAKKRALVRLQDMQTRSVTLTDLSKGPVTDASKNILVLGSIEINYIIREFPGYHGWQQDDFVYRNNARVDIRDPSILRNLETSVLANPSLIDTIVLATIYQHGNFQNMVGFGLLGVLNRTGAWRRMNTLVVDDPRWITYGLLQNVIPALKGLDRIVFQNFRNYKWIDSNTPLQFLVSQIRYEQNITPEIVVEDMRLVTERSAQNALLEYNTWRDAKIRAQSIALYSAPRGAVPSQPVERFLRRDGDNAVMHRTMGYLIGGNGAFVLPGME